MRIRSLSVVVCAALVVAAAAVTLTAGGNNRAEAQSVEPRSAAEKATLLATAARVDPATTWSPYIVGSANARVQAAQLASAIPLPATGTFDDLKWHVADEGGLSRAEMQAVMEFNALCDWEHAIDARGSATAAELAVLRTVPHWPSFRGRDHTKYVADLVAALERGDLLPLRDHMAVNCRF
jgi:hypothetical protein